MNHIPFCNNPSLMEYAKPVIRFIAFLQCDLKLVDEICFDGSVIRLMDIRADACPAAKQLIDDGGCFVASFHCIAQMDHVNGKLL